MKKEGHMSLEKNLKYSSAVMTLRIILHVLVVFSLFWFIASVSAWTIHSFSIKMGAARMNLFRTIFGKGLGAPLYVFIAFCLFKLTNLIAHREPFNPSSPRYVRRIAYAVFSLFFVNAIISAINEFASPEVVISDAIIRFLFSGGLIALVLGFGFLVIAAVLDVGVKLQQEQNLTV
jgi:hypothetical protein